jgi:hypothetical protein
MKKTISNLTDVVAQLQHDVKKIKIRMGIWVRIKKSLDILNMKIS